MIARINRVPNDVEDPERVPQRNRPRVNYHHIRQESDLFPDPSLLDPIDDDQGSQVCDAVSNMLKRAKDNGLQSELCARLSKTVEEHPDIFCESFSAGPPANARPLQIQLRPDAKPIRVCLQKYSHEQRKFLWDMISRLLRCGMIVPNPSASWACAPLLVPKPGPTRFRFTVDLHPVNIYTVRHHFPMPNIEQELTSGSSSKVFPKFDLSHGYWQFSLAAGLQESQSFITPDGDYTPALVLHGTTNAVTHLQ